MNSKEQRALCAWANCGDQCQAARAMLAALKGVLEAYSMGPIDCAAKYGPDVDLREMERTATQNARAAIAAAETAGITVEPFTTEQACNGVAP